MIMYIHYCIHYCIYMLNRCARPQHLHRAAAHPGTAAFLARGLTEYSRVRINLIDTLSYKRPPCPPCSMPCPASPYNNLSCALLCFALFRCATRCGVVQNTSNKSLLHDADKLIICCGQVALLDD